MASSRVGRAWAWFDACPVLNLLIYVLCFPLLELCFLFRVRRYMRLRSGLAVDHSADDTAEVKRFWTVVLSEGGESVERVLRGWFPGTDALYARQIEELIGWTLYNVGLSELDAGELQRSGLLTQSLYIPISSLSSAGG